MSKEKIPAAVGPSPCELNCGQREFCANTLSACRAFATYVSRGKYSLSSLSRMRATPTPEVYNRVFFGEGELA